MERTGNGTLPRIRSVIGTEHRVRTVMVIYPGKIPVQRPVHSELDGIVTVPRHSTCTGAVSRERTGNSTVLRDTSGNVSVLRERTGNGAVHRQPTAPVPCT